MLLASKLLPCARRCPCPASSHNPERGRGGAEEPAPLSKVTGAARGTEELVPGSAWCQKVSAFHHLGEMEIQPKAKERHLSQPETLTTSPVWG